MKKFLIIVFALLISASAFIGPKPFIRPKAAEADAQLTSKAAYLIDNNSGKVMFSKNENQRLPIASMVKVTTLAVIYDLIEEGKLNLEDEVTVSQTASSMGGSQAFLDAGEVQKVGELIKSIVVASANDSVIALAEHTFGSESTFVEQMNDLAKKLGMNDTAYVNATGLPAAGGFSTAKDVATIYRYSMQKSTHFLYSKEWMYDFTHNSGRTTTLTNTNKLSRFYEGCEGGKTGFTNEAGSCLVVSAKRGIMNPVAVVIGANGSKERFKEASDLLNKAFNNFKNTLIIDSEQVLTEKPLSGAVEEKVKLYAKNSFYALLDKTEENNYEYTYSINDDIKAPLKCGQVVGKIIISRAGQIEAEIDVIVKKDIKTSTLVNRLDKIIDHWDIA